MGAGASRFRHGHYAGAGTGKRLETTHSAHLFVTPGGKTVYYTHLDVYKRQPLVSPRGTRNYVSLPVQLQVKTALPA